MSLSGEERETLAAIEAGVREQDPELARRLATFTRPHRSRRWLWVVLVVLLVLVPLTLIAGMALHSVVLNALGAVLVGVLLTLAAVLSGGAF